MISTWDRIGTDVSNKKNIDEVLKASGLDYEVVKAPLYYSGNKIKIEDKVATVRKSDKKLYGIVGNNYEICQNKDAFDFINYINEDVEFVKAGETRGGLVYVIAKMEEVDILGDSFAPHIIFQNGHNGGISLRASICPLRIVCQNQFSLAFKESNSTINIRHNQSLNAKILESREVLSNVSDFMRTLSNRAKMLNDIKISASKVDSIIDSMFKIKEDMSTRTVNAIEQRRAEFMKAYNSDDNQNFKGTAWSLVNAYTNYITHSTPARKLENWEENRFMYVTFNNSLVNNFIEMVEKAA